MDQWPFLYVDFKKDFDLSDLSVQSIDKFVQRLKTELKFTQKYMTNKIGYNHSVEYELKNAMEIYNVDDDLLDISPNNNHIHRFICLISESLTKDELSDCIERNKPAPKSLII
jgi:hypothetical protein